MCPQDSEEDFQFHLLSQSLVSVLLQDNEEFLPFHLSLFLALYYHLVSGHLRHGEFFKGTKINTALV